MTSGEFSRLVRVETIGSQPRALRIEADESERTALARRFGLAGLHRLEAELSVVRAGDVTASGRMAAEAVQTCIATGTPVPARIDEGFTVHFCAEGVGGDDEVELAEDELDTIFYEGASIDVGEAVAQTLALALDPYPRADEATQALSEAGVKSDSEAGPFGGLAALRDRLGK